MQSITGILGTYHVSTVDITERNDNVQFLLTPGDECILKSVLKSASSRK